MSSNKENVGGRQRADGAGRGRLHAMVAHQLGVAIVAGKLAPGQVLDDEVRSSEELKVSRTAYREAMKILGAKGLVDSRPKIGTRINPRDRWNHLDPDVLAWSFETTPDESFINDLFELRSIIEPQAAALAAARRNKGELARMELALQVMERETLASPEGQAADRDFHSALLDATRNEALKSLSSGISAAVRWTSIFKQREHALPRDPVPDHVKVFEAIAAGKARNARMAMEKLIRLSFEDMRSSMTRSPSQRSAEKR